MNLSPRTITALAEIITGDGYCDSTEKLSSYETLERITDFFCDFGEHHFHLRPGAPSRFGDAAGAIANSYALIEEFRKQLLRKTGTTFNKHEGYIRALYNLAAAPCILTRKASRLRTNSRQSGSGPNCRSAASSSLPTKPATGTRASTIQRGITRSSNAAFTLCEFLLEPFEYKQKKNQRRAS